MKRTEPPPADALAPHSDEAERGVLACCLQDPSKTVLALKAGVNRRWFYDLRHAEVFSVLAEIALNGGGDFVTVNIRLREAGLLEQIGGLPFLADLQNAAPAAENLTFYLPVLQDRVQRRAILDAVTRLKQLAEDTTADPAQLLADAEAALQSYRRSADADALPEIVSAIDLLAETMPLPAELVAGVLHAGSKLILGGSSKSYKSWSLADLALSVAAGAPWLGFETTAGKVLYVNLEIQKGFFRRRIAAIAQAKGVEVNANLQLWNLRGYAADYRTLLPKIRARIKDEGHALLIIDPTYKLLGAADENSATDISALLNGVEDLAVTTGAAVAMAGHFAKGNAAGKEVIDRISGSGVFARDPDSLVIFTKHETEGAFSVECVLRNFAPVQSFAVRWECPLFRRADDLDPARLKQTGGRRKEYDPQKLVAAIVETTAENPVSISAWAKAAGITRQTLQGYLPGLRAKGWIQTAGEGNEARQFLSERGKEAASRYLKEQQ